MPARVNIAGPGLDGELDAATLRIRLRAVNAPRVGALSKRDADFVSSALAWHPSEATTLALAAASGIRGNVEIRTAGAIVNLTGDSAAVYSPSVTDVLANSVMGSAV